jgi:hypothetical protein
MNEKKLSKHFFGGVLTILVFTVLGCGSVQHKVSFQENYVIQPNTKIEVGKVTNETGQTFDVNVEEMLSNSLSGALGEKKLLWTGDEGHKLILNSKIVEYEKGDAFKRWLLPGWGATVLSVQADLKDGDQLVGTAEARRTVSAGGGYTIGAWRTVFNGLANDVVDDLVSKIAK